MVTASMTATAAKTVSTAFEALRLLPPDVARRIALIEGRDGAPVPERWYLVVYDPTQEHHLVEYVVVGKRVAAARTISQFAQDLSPDDIIPTDSALLNSDAAGQLAQQFAQANNIRVPKLNYELKKQGAGAVPLWKITCLGESSNPFAQITLAAGSGMIVQTEGFNFAPNLASHERPPEKADRATPDLREPEREDVRDEPERAEVRRQVNRDIPQKGKQSREVAKGSLPVLKGKLVTSQDRAANPPPVAQRPPGLFGAIRHLFAR